MRQLVTLCLHSGRKEGEREKREGGREEREGGSYSVGFERVERERRGR